MTAIKEKNTMIDLDDHGQAYLLGDVHGDPFAFGPFFLPGAPRFTPRLSDSAKCHRGKTPLKGPKEACRWTGGAAVVVFSGTLGQQPL